MDNYRILSSKVTKLIMKNWYVKHWCLSYDIFSTNKTLLKKLKTCKKWFVISQNFINDKYKNKFLRPIFYNVIEYMDLKVKVFVIIFQKNRNFRSSANDNYLINYYWFIIPYFLPLTTMVHHLVDCIALFSLLIQALYSRFKCFLPIRR